MIRILLAFALVLGMAPAGLAQSGAGPSIVIDHPWARASAPMMTTGVAYLTIVNNGMTDDRLLAVATPVADKAEPHSTITENGVMKMRPVPAIDVKAGGKAELKPGGLHLMLTGLKAPLKEGETFPLTLTFEKAGAVETMVKIEKAGAMGGAGMPGMGMPGMKM